YSVHDGEPKTTLTDLRKVLSVPSTVNPDGLAPFTVIGANLAYALLFEDIVKYGNPNSTLREQNEATLSLISPFGKAGKVKKGMEALKDMEKGLEAARDLANNANKVEKTHHTQKEIQEVGEYSKKLLDNGTGKVSKVKAEDVAFSDKFSKGKFKNQVAERGWTNEKIADAINNPVKVGESVNKATGNKVELYFVDDVHYVAIDKGTGKVIQVADLNKADWVPEGGL
ncbi:colicin E5-related ribonuclease, partial [Lysinibacillus xylanilyticus]|uniref:colicin E5-related ribonuclease n=1 Tax=Lysinibacillus xylanilyticus TaxID=582475 RepID=UPI003D044A94